MSHVTTDVTTSERDGLLAVTLRPPAQPEDPVSAWMVDALAALIAAVRERAGSIGNRPTRIALVLHSPATRDREESAAAEGLASGVRGVAQSLALELAPGTCVNAVLCDAAGSPDDELGLLGGPDGGFVTGATLDVRGAA